MRDSAMGGHGDVGPHARRRESDRRFAEADVVGDAMRGGVQPSDTSALLPQTIGAQQHSFAERLARVNVPGNLEGLFGYHVIGDDRALPFQWHVASLSDEWLSQHANRATQTPILAAIGYGLNALRERAPASVAAFEQGAHALRQRDPFPADRVSFAYQPTTYLGLALGAVALGGSGDALRTWLHNTLLQRLKQEIAPFQRLEFAYIDHVLTHTVASVADIDQYHTADDLAALLWCAGQGAIRLVAPGSNVNQLQREVLRLALLQDAAALDATRAAILWRTVADILDHAVADVLQSSPYVAVILRRFEAAMRRWRWDEDARVKNPVRWVIRSEREVQDILWLILRSVFDDVLDEETLPKFGHSTYRADFGIPSLRLLIEVKFVRQASDFKTIEKEILEDSVGYLHATSRYDRILAFIYDHSASVQMHEDTARDLQRLPAIEDVIIISRPSQIPADVLDGSGR